MKLTVQICTLKKRKALFDVLKAELNRQKTDYGFSDDTVEIIDECDEGQMNIGAKRNLLLDRAKGDYVCSIDDDDWIDSEYLIKIITALDSFPDCAQLIGMMNTDGFNLKRFEHSIAHQGYFERNEIFYRPPNHLNAIKASIAKQFKFPEMNFGEDTDWALQIKDSGLLRREEPIDKVIYHYRYCSRK